PARSSTMPETTNAKIHRRCRMRLSLLFSAPYRFRAAFANPSFFWPNLMGAAVFALLITSYTIIARPMTIISTKIISIMDFMAFSLSSATRDILLCGHNDDIWNRGWAFLRLLLIPQNNLAFPQ